MRGKPWGSEVQSVFSKGDEPRPQCKSIEPQLAWQKRLAINLRGGIDCPNSGRLAQIETLPKSGRSSSSDGQLKVRVVIFRFFRVIRR